MNDTEIYGTDYSSDGFITSNGDIGLVTELANAEQAIIGTVNFSISHFVTATILDPSTSVFMF